MSSTNSSYISVASGHIDSLIDYVLEVKPYHTKLSEIVEEYLFNDNIGVKINDGHKVLAFVGADILPSTYTLPGVRLRRSNTWLRDIVSDGSRVSWSVPPVSMNKLSKDNRSEQFICGQNDDTQIAGLSTGVFDPRRWSGPGITSVLKNQVHQQESIDYFLSHGVFSFSTYDNSTNWKESDIETISAMAQQPGALFYKDLVRSFGVVSEITNGNYEEWTLTCINDLFEQPAVFEVRGSISGVIGEALYGETFSHPLISFKISELQSQVQQPPIIGNKFVLTPFNKITVSPHTGETWSLIKTNPIVLEAKPEFIPSQPRSDTPILEVYTRSLDSTEPSEWVVEFTSATEYSVTKISANGYVETATLADGYSFKNADIHFTILPPTVPFNTGDKFTFTVGSRIEQFLVYGSLSGWQANAKIGEWYWNGKIGFKIPELKYFANAFNSTISISTDVSTNSWSTIVSNSQSFRKVVYQNGIFLATGDGSIVAASADGTTWTSDISSIFTPQPGQLFVILGGRGTIITSADGVQWFSQNSPTSENLKALSFIPSSMQFLQANGQYVNCIIAVGGTGTILTSINGVNWARQVSNTTSSLNAIAWSNDAIIVVGDNGTIRRSVDRLNWTTPDSHTTANLNDVIFDAASNSFIAIGDAGTIVRSTDGGITWNNLNQFLDGKFTAIASSPNKFVIVGTDGWVAHSEDGIVWSRYMSKAFNSVAYGSGTFVAVGGKTRTFAQFEELKPVHSSAQASTYTITFNSATTASVVNNIHGFRAGLKVNEPWSDEFCAFKLVSIPGVYEYTAGDIVTVHIAPEQIYKTEAWYDELPYDTAGYDLGAAEMPIPLVLDQDIFPLFHSHGSVIFKDCQLGDLITINKTFMDIVRFRIFGSSQTTPELNAQNDWIPLEFRTFDTLTSDSNFGDITTRIEAYLGSNPDVKVFTISQPRFQDTNKNVSAILTFDQQFFNTYLKFNTKYSILFLPEQQFGNTIRVKVTENVRTYARVRLEFTDISYVTAAESPIKHWTPIYNIDFIDLVNVAFVEGGALPFAGEYDNLGYDILPYDVTAVSAVGGMVEVSPGVYEWTGNPEDWVMPKATPEPGIQVSDTAEPDSTAASFVENFSIAERVVGSGLEISRLSIFYDLARYTPETGGMLISTAANEYLITHNGLPSTPTLIVESVDNPGVFGNPTPNLNTYTQQPMALNLMAFSFTLPPGFTAPFRLTIV